MRAFQAKSRKTGSKKKIILRMKLVSLFPLIQLSSALYKTESATACQAVCKNVSKCSVWSWNGKTIFAGYHPRTRQMMYDHGKDYGTCILMQGHSYTLAEERQMFTG